MEIYIETEIALKSTQCTRPADSRRPFEIIYVFVISSGRRKIFKINSSQRTVEQLCLITACSPVDTKRVDCFSLPASISTNPINMPFCETSSLGPTSFLSRPLVTKRHYTDVIMSAMTSEITSVSIVYSTVCSGADQRKHQSSTSLAFVRGSHR